MRMTYPLSDALFLIGVILLVLAAMGAVKNSGLFNIVGYSNKRFMDLILNRPRDNSAYENEYAQYVNRPRKKHDIRLFAVGGLFCWLAAMLAAALSW